MLGTASLVGPHDIAANPSRAANAAAAPLDPLARLIDKHRKPLRAGAIERSDPPGRTEAQGPKARSFLRARLPYTGTEHDEDGGGPPAPVPIGDEIEVGIENEIGFEQLIRL